MEGPTEDLTSQQDPDLLSPGEVIQAIPGSLSVHNVNL